MKELGIIYCPNHRPFTSPKKRWEKIAALLQKYNIDYDMVQSEQAQGVERLVTMMLNNGYRSIVIAGGDGALNDAVNCFMKLEKHVRDNVSLGVIPNGTMNDFAKYWGFDYDNIEESVASLAQHRVRKIDVGCLRYKNKEAESKQRYFLNCVNVGLLARIQTLRQNTRRKLWSRKISFLVSLLLIIFQKMVFKMRYTINYTEERHRVMTLCIGNALGYGQTPSATPYNNMLDITIVRRSAWMQLFEGIYLYLRGEILNHKRVRPYRTRMIEIDSDKRLPISIDGHPISSPVGKFKVEVEAEQINFIIERYNVTKVME